MSDAPPIDLSAALPCHRCGYDVRAQPAEGSCPECEALVVDSRRMALIPIRPAWRDSDPRWRRRMLAGAWVLVLMPLMEWLQANRWAHRVPVPTFFDVQGTQTLGTSYAPYVYTYLMFCVGAVLLSAKERHRQIGPLDSLRRWGVIGSYLVLWLGVPQFAFLASLVILGLAALCQSMPLAQQPAITGLLVKIGTGYMYYGPVPGQLGDASLVAFSAIIVLLAGVPLFNAMGGSGPRVLAVLLLVPLAIASMVQLGYAGVYALTPGAIKETLISGHFFYLDAKLLGQGFEKANASGGGREFIGEAIKWLAILAIALWLSIAQVAAIVHRGKFSRATRGA